VTFLPPGISVVIPAYESADSLPELVRRLGLVLPAVASEFEIVIVNDGSRDATWETIQSLSAANRFVRGICLMRNYGQHNALLCGIRAARFATLVTMDDDLQHPPEVLPTLVAALSSNVDVVYASPESEQHGMLRNFASVVTKLALKNAMGAENARHVSAWRVFRTHLRDSFATYQGPYVSIDVLLTWGTVRFSAIKLRHDPRTIGVSHYTVTKLLRHAMNMMTGFSVAPLHAASVIGFTFTLFGFGVLAYVLGRYFLFGSTVAGFPFLASIIAIFSGAQLFALGIIGEYLSRMHFRVMDKPSYAVRSDSAGS
jgi:glycosyltransferase involved in cell wall biosynthesis